MKRAKPSLHEPRWAALLIGMPTLSFTGLPGTVLTLHFMRSQDLPVLLGMTILLLGVAFFAPRLSLPRSLPPRSMLVVIGLAIMLLLGWGCYELMDNFPLSRDEHMVLFDMAVFEKGRFAAPVALEWRGFAKALVPDFLLNSDHPIGFVSDYLPVNAALRLGFSWIADPVFFNPCLALIGGVALMDIARRAFAEDVGAQWVVLLIYALSSQMLVAAMTTYAMTAHMALNLVWLAAYLRGGKSGNSIAIVVAFLATGLHQIVFHVLFAAPFLLWRLRQGRWQAVAAYVAAYCIILGFWAGYPLFVRQMTGISHSGIEQNGSILGKIMELLVNQKVTGIAFMFFNLMRFFAWQNIALLPLLIAAAPLCWQGRTLAGPLLWGIVALLLLVTILLPYQGHGWGYRYLQPYFGSFALLAGFGYQRLAQQIGPKADGMVVVLSAATLCLSLPWLLWAAHRFVAPHAALEQVVSQHDTDFVIIDTQPSTSLDGRWVANARELVRNAPDLDNVPLRLSSAHLTPEMLSQVCRRGTVSVVTRADMRGVGFGLNAEPDSPQFTNLMNVIKGQRCGLSTEKRLVPHILTKGPSQPQPRSRQESFH